MNADPENDNPGFSIEKRFDVNQRQIFSQESVYSIDTVSQSVPERSINYSDYLLKRCMELVDRHVENSVVLDICCATGQHINGFSDIINKGVGIDFVLPFLKKANEDKSASSANTVFFICCDAKRLPFRSGYFEVAYSFSSFYAIPNVGKAIKEMSRMLKPGGICIFDLGNLYSINIAVANTYHKELNWAKQFPITVPEMRQLIRDAGLRILEHHAFQFLPLWTADRPIWLRPLLWKGWTRLLTRNLGGKMLDEWISSLPVLNFFAFRHVFVCEKG